MMRDELIDQAVKRQVRLLKYMRMVHQRYDETVVAGEIYPSEVRAIREDFVELRRMWHEPREVSLGY